mgnify:CR=1 FL=1
MDTVRISVGRGKDGFYRPAFLGLKYLFRQRESQEGPNHFFALGNHSEAEETDSGLLMIGCIKKLSLSN